jgi:hypothetical protein
MSYRIFPLQTNDQRTYIRLTQVLDWLEPEIFGGDTKREPAKQLALVQYGGLPPIRDDIAGKHKFFRSRSQAVVTRFLDDHDLKPGDMIKLERLGPFSYRFMPG